MAVAMATAIWSGVFSSPTLLCKTAFQLLPKNQPNFFQCIIIIIAIRQVDVVTKLKLTLGRFKGVTPLIGTKDLFFISLATAASLVQSELYLT